MWNLYKLSNQKSLEVLDRVYQTCNVISNVKKVKNNFLLFWYQIHVPTALKCLYISTLFLGIYMSSAVLIACQISQTYMYHIRYCNDNKPINPRWNTSKLFQICTMWFGQCLRRLCRNEKYNFKSTLTDYKYYLQSMTSFN